MRTFNEYILEKQNFIFGGKAGLTGKEYKQHYNYAPKNAQEFIALMNKLYKERGDEGDFNDINTSSLTNMSGIFWGSQSFNGDIMQWDMSNVKDMSYMFDAAKKFNQDISIWDTSNVVDMSWMFYGALSFNQDISSWDVSKVTDMKGIFDECPIKEEFKPKFKK